MSKSFLSKDNAPATVAKAPIADNRVYATGRRKTASARVWIKPGTGKFLVNDRSVDDYFPRDAWKAMLMQPFAAAGAVDEFDVICTVSGSGLSGQAGAIRYGISRALDLANPVFRPKLREEGLLTRDARKVERKKYGRKKARRSFQFCKR